MNSGVETAAWSFAFGFVLALSNFAIVFFFVRRVFKKKQVARSSAVIIFKYLILGLIIHFVVTRTNLSLFWIGAGLISVMFTLVLMRGKLESVE